MSTYEQRGPDNLAPQPLTDESRVLVTGMNGLLGRTLQATMPEATFMSRREFDITDPNAYDRIPWQDYDVIINAAAYTKTDAAMPRPDQGIAGLLGAAESEHANSYGPRLLARLAVREGITLVHVSSEYVFNGRAPIHDETEPFDPLNMYGATKAAGDTEVQKVWQHYLVRTSWVFGDGKGFVLGMKRLADQVKAGQSDGTPMVNDQIGRLTYAPVLTEGIAHLLRTGAPYGAYNLTNSGPPASFADIAQRVFEKAGVSPDYITPMPTIERHGARLGTEVDYRPTHSTLNLAKIEATGFYPPDWRDSLDDYWQSAFGNNYQRHPGHP